jgi:uncharacterized protein (TIGR03437 family)
MKTRAIGILFCWLLFCFPGSGQPSALPVANFPGLPPSFEANAGQADPSVKFLFRGNGYRLYLTSHEAVLALSQGGCSGSSFQPSNLGRHEAICAHETDVMRMRLAGAREGTASPVGEQQLPGVANYLIGNDPARWHTGVPTYQRVRYPGIYPGVDLVYHQSARQLEYDFVLAPGADSKQIRLQFPNARGVRLGANGDLAVITTGGTVSLHKPVVYQVVNGRRQSVDGGFTLFPGSTAGFRLGAYDRTQPLVIDPVLVYSTFLGGSSADAANAIAVDAQGNLYVSGSAGSTDFPLSQGAIQGTNNSRVQAPTAFAAKLDPTGTTLLYSTYLGGSHGDVAYGLAVDTSGNAYITGATTSADFPSTIGAFQTANPGIRSAFISKLNPTGTALVYSTYLGGGSGGYGLGELARAIVVDSAGNAYVAGASFSGNFPLTAGAVQTQNKCFFCSQAFAVKLNPAGSALLYSTYLGGTGAGVFSIGPAVFQGDSATGLWVDAAGNTYVTGYAYSSDFPVTAGAFQTKNVAYQTSGTVSSNPGYNTFVTKLNPTATALLYSTYVGGHGHDGAAGIAVDAAGNAYIAGGASSADFPVTAGALQLANRSASASNAFVAKLNPTGSSLLYSTYLGGTGNDTATSLAIDSAGDVFLAGAATSTDFPVTAGAFQTANLSTAGNTAFLTELNPAVNALVYSTYLGGSGTDTAAALALDSSGKVYLAGSSSSVDFPVTPGAFQTTNHSRNSASNAFIAKLDLSAALPAPAIATGGINPVFSTASTIQPGELIWIKGNNLASSTVSSNGKYPTSLGGTSVTINGKAAYLMYVSPTQINLQAPDDSTTGPVPVMVRTATGASTSSVNLAPIAPSFLLLDNKHVAAIILRLDGTGAYGAGTYDILGPTGNSLGYATVAAKAGDILELFAVGLGPTGQTVPAGQPFTGAARATSPVNLLINNAGVTPLFAGLASQGLGQINLIVPPGLGSGDVSLQVLVGGVPSQPGVVISLQ